MSRDSRARANKRAEYGPAPVELTQQVKDWRAKARRDGKVRAKRRLTADDISNRFNSHSHLHFGVYADREIGNIPVSYLQWIVSTFRPRDARTKGLVMFLKVYLSRGMEANCKAS